MRPAKSLAFLVLPIAILSCSGSSRSPVPTASSPTATIVVRAPAAAPARICGRCVAGPPQLEAVADLVVEETAGVAGEIASVGVVLANTSRTIEGPGLLDATVLANFGVTSRSLPARGSLTLREIGLHFDATLRDQLPATLRFTVNVRDANGHAVAAEAAIAITPP